jgi:predicted RNase H-like HicB family nuclease
MVRASSRKGIDVIRGTILVRAIWDADADVFVATSSDVPGLVTEAATLQELQAKLKVLIPELLELNGSLTVADGDEAYPDEIPLVLMSEQVTKVRLRAHG